MKIGIDMDGVVAFSWLGHFNPSLPLPQWLLFLGIPFILFSFPYPKKKNIIKTLSKHHEIIFISGRPSWSLFLTKLWLKFYQIPFHKIYCVGYGKGMKERKLEIIKKEKIELFIEDDKRIIDFLKKNSIKALSI